MAVLQVAASYGAVRTIASAINHVFNNLDWVNEKIEKFVYSCCRNVGMSRHWAY